MSYRQLLIAGADAKLNEAVQAITALSPAVTLVQQREFFPATYREVSGARERYCNESGDVEIDDDAGASEADSGTWVQAWVWLPNNKTE